MDGQGIGSLTLQDSAWTDIQFGLTLKRSTVSSATLLDDLTTERCANIIMNGGDLSAPLAGNSDGSYKIVQ